MSIAKLKRAEPLTNAGHGTAQDYYPRYLVISGVLAFCLTAWALVIVAVAHYAA